MGADIVWHRCINKLTVILQIGNIFMQIQKSGNGLLLLRDSSVLNTGVI